MDLLRTAFRHDNPATLADLGYRQFRHGGDGGQLRLDPGERVVCGVHGLFGERMADELARDGAEVDAGRGASGGGRSIATRLIDAVDQRRSERCSSCTARPRPASAQPLDGLAEPVANTMRCCWSTA